ncbi:unnamed protein product [Rotaria socialis]
MLSKYRSNASYRREAKSVTVYTHESKCELVHISEIIFKINIIVIYERCEKQICGRQRKQLANEPRHFLELTVISCVNQL